MQHVRDGRLYRATHSSFESYCRERWGIGKSYAYQIMASACVAVEVSATADIKTERAARELSKVEPEHREEVVRKAAEAGPVTAKAINQAAAEVAPVVEEAREVEAVLAEDGLTRAQYFTFKMMAIVGAAKEGVGDLNPTGSELIQAALMFKRLGNELERAAAELPE